MRKLAVTLLFLVVTVTAIFAQAEPVRRSIFVADKFRAMSGGVESRWLKFLLASIDRFPYHLYYRRNGALINQIA